MTHDFGPLPEPDPDFYRITPFQRGVLAFLCVTCWPARKALDHLEARRAR